MVMKDMMGTKKATRKRTPAPKMDPWEVQNAADTLARAAEIKANRRMMSAVKRHEMKRRKEMDKALKTK